MARLDVPPRLHRSAHLDVDAHRRSARWLLAYLVEILGVPDLGEVDVLDVGCGTKFSQAIVNGDLPVASYHGVDVDAEVIAFLCRHNPDPRFTYHHLPVRNDRYNPDAPAMTDAEDLGCGDRRFDLITLCSVFTHLGPDDFRAMLHLVRRYVEPDGTLFFTVFIDELTVGGHGLADHLDRKLGGGGTDAPLELRQVLRPVSPYTDLDPEQPLAYALYSRAHVLDLVDGTGWAIEELRDPVEHAQHHLICTPA